MILNNKNYNDIFIDIKNELQVTRQNISFGVNKELILMYYRIGIKLKENNDWGSSFIDSLAKDIKLEFPNLKGMSARNLRYMQKFSGLYDYDEFLQEVLAKLSWYHNIVLMDKLDTIEKRKWYAVNALENGWSSTVLIHQIATNLYNRQALLDNKISNFRETLPAATSELTLELLKDPYIFDFISSKKSMKELDFENALINNITKFLLELGNSFAFVGRQYHLQIDNEDYYIDLLFYNTKIHSYVVIELKTTKFKPEFVGQLNFYVNAIDGQVKNENDNSTIGILLRKDKNRLSAEYSLKNISSPIAISEFKYLEELPDYLNNKLTLDADLIDK